jgi:predicted amidohydrolase YtcJ
VSLLSDGEVLLFRGRDDSASVAVADGVIVALGAEAVEAPRRRGARARVVDVGDGAVVPAFRDGHLHPLWGGVEQLGAPVAGARSFRELLRRVAEHARAHPEQRWITGGGYDPALLPGGLGDATALDAVVGDRPVLLWSTDHHMAWANSAALSRADVTAATPDPDGGRIVRHPDGTPTGALLEEAAHAVAAHAPRPTGAQKEQGLRRALANMVACGIVWGLDASVGPSDVAVYRRLAAAEALPCRMALALRVDPGRWHEREADFAAIRADVGGGPGAPLTVNTVKFFADGVVEAGTAAMIEPYADDPCRHGIANWEPAELAEAVAVFDRLGFGVHVHAIGDAAVRSALDAIEHAGRVNGPRDRRPAIAHAQVVQPDDLGRFRDLGVVANFQPLWAQRDRIMTELTEPRLGPRRTDWQYPIGALDRLGTRISFGSDWPVTSMRPLDGLGVAVTRQTRDRRPPGGWLPEQRLPVERAFSAYTAGVAFQAFEEAITGRVAVGQRADLCVLSTDPRRVPPSELPAVEVLGTWSGGVQVFGR